MFATQALTQVTSERPASSAKKSQNCMTDSGDYTRFNRGMAILGDEVFLGTLKAHVIALDANTGNVVWDVTAAAYRTGHGFTVAPGFSYCFPRFTGFPRLTEQRVP